MSHRFLPPVVAALGLSLVGCSDEGRTEWGEPWNPSGITAAMDGDDGDDGSSEGDDAADDSADDSADDNADTAPTTDNLTTGELTAGEESSTGPAVPPPSPYMGGWDIGTCQDAVTSSIPDVSLTDQYGDSVRIYDFCHKAILLVGGAFW